MAVWVVLTVASMGGMLGTVISNVGWATYAKGVYPADYHTPAITYVMSVAVLASFLLPLTMMWLKQRQFVKKFLAENYR